MGKGELAHKCGYPSTNYFWNTYIPQNYPDLLATMVELGYNRKMRLLPERIVKVVMDEFITEGE